MSVKRYIIWLIPIVPLALFGWLSWQFLVPSGVFVVERAVDERSAYMDRMLPDGRVLDIAYTKNGDPVRPLVGDPVFFFGHPHRHFDTVKADIWFDPQDVEVVEFGGLASETAQAYDLHPFYNRTLEELGWERFANNGEVVYQRTKRYDSIDAFVASPPDIHEIAVYYPSSTIPLRRADYKPSETSVRYDLGLRGFHELKTYVKDEPLQIDLTFHALDEQQAPESVNVLLVDEQGVVLREFSGTAEEGRLEISASGLSEGVYKLIWQASDNVVFDQMRTKLSKLVFLHQLDATERDRALTVWTNGTAVRLQTEKQEGVQSARVGSETIRIERPYETAHVTNPDRSLDQVSLPNGQVQVNTVGSISLTPESWFLSEPMRLQPGTDLDAADVNYILTTYQSPGEDGDFLRGKAVIDTAKLADEEGSWKFAFSLPGIEEKGARVDIHKIRMRWERDPLRLHQLPDLVRSFWQRIRN